MDTHFNWIKVADALNTLVFNDSHIATTQVNEKNICIAKFNQQYFGFAYHCPHAAAIMADGYIDAKGNAVCPLHHYKFSLQSGRNVSGEGYFMKTFPVEIRNDGVWIGMK